MTRQALEPEFSRLRVAHEHELSLMEARFEDEERKAKADLKSVFRDKLAGEERACKAAGKDNSRRVLDDTIEECKELEGKHKHRYDELAEELEQDLSRYKTKLTRQLEHDDGLAARELDSASQQMQETLKRKAQMNNEEILDIQEQHKLEVQIYDLCISRDFFCRVIIVCMCILICICTYT